MVGPEDVLAAAATCLDRLEPLQAVSWDIPVPGLDFTVARVIAHAANGPLWYAIDLWSGTGDDAAFDLKVRTDAPNGALLLSLGTAARVCAASITAAPSDLRGFHPAGAADPSGFAAMACDEMLVHTHDAATGLGVRFRPDPDLAGRVLTRLFPWHHPEADPWETLLWANGRVDLPGRTRQGTWRWHCAPLADWNGSPPLET